MKKQQGIVGNGYWEKKGGSNFKPTHPGEMCMVIYTCILTIHTKKEGCEYIRRYMHGRRWSMPIILRKLLTIWLLQLQVHGFTSTSTGAWEAGHWLSWGTARSYHSSTEYRWKFEACPSTQARPHIHGSKKVRRVCVYIAWVDLRYNLWKVVNTNIKMFSPSMIGPLLTE